MTSESLSSRRAPSWTRNPRQAFHGMSLRAKLMFLFLAVTVLAASAVAYVTILRTTTALTEQVGEGLVAVAGTQAHNLGIVLAQRVRSMQAWTVEPAHMGRVWSLLRT